LLKANTVVKESLLHVEGAFFTFVSAEFEPDSARTMQGTETGFCNVNFQLPVLLELTNPKRLLFDELLTLIV
jgi:hypothetical protein